MTIKFLTLNIWKGNLLPKVIDFVNQEDPDIFVLQEVYNSENQGFVEKFRAFSVIRERTNCRHAVFSPAFLDETDDVGVENGNAIFSKFPITSVDTTFYDFPFGPYINTSENYTSCPRTLVQAVVSSGENTLHVFNTHGIWGEDGNDNERRLRMSETIVQAINGMQRVILAGDFNMYPATRSIRNIERHLHNVSAGKLTSTFNMKRKRQKGGYRNAVVDMIFVSPDISVVQQSCPQVDVSDHLPLVATFEI